MGGGEGSRGMSGGKGGLTIFGRGRNSHEVCMFVSNSILGGLLKISPPNFPPPTTPNLLHLGFLSIFLESGRKRPQNPEIL